MKRYKIKLVPLSEDNGLDFMTLDISADSRDNARHIALNQPFTGPDKYRLHDDERSKS